MIHRVKFINCKMVGASFIGSYLGNTLFTECLLNFANFSDSKLKTVVFDKCTMDSFRYGRNLPLIKLLSPIAI